MGAAVKRVLAAHQPNYLPWLGLFHKLSQADVFVVADDLQFSKHAFINRVRIRTATGSQWLTVPVRTRGKGLQEIRDVEVDGDSWQAKHWKTIEWNYRQAHHYDDFAPFLEAFYRDGTSTRLLDINLRLLDYLRAQLQIDVETRLSSHLSLPEERTRRLVEMARACGCDAYLAGSGASKQYLDQECFRAAGIELCFVEFEHPEYRQCFPGFEAKMSALDLLLNYGAGGARETMRRVTA